MMMPGDPKTIFLRPKCAEKGSIRHLEQEIRAAYLKQLKGK